MAKCSSEIVLIDHVMSCDKNPSIYLPAWRVEFRVDLVYNPAEQPPIESLCHGVTNVHSLFNGVWSDNGFTVGDHLRGGECILKLLRFDLQQRSHCGEERRGEGGREREKEEMKGGEGGIEKRKIDREGRGGRDREKKD